MSQESQENCVYIGRKNTMNYCLVCVSMFQNQDVNECVIRARGRAISKAVDVAEITARRFLPAIVEIADVKIGSEELEGADKTKVVSTIDIVLRRKS